MFTKVNSLGLKGLESYPVKVDVKVQDGVEAFIIFGLPDLSVNKSRERVSTALHNMGYSSVEQKVFVNLSPVDQRAARQRQYKGHNPTITNVEVLYEQLVEKSPLSSNQTTIIQEFCAMNGLSNRSQIKVICLARTISDLVGKEMISDEAIIEYWKAEVKGRLEFQRLGEANG